MKRALKIIVLFIVLGFSSRNTTAQTRIDTIRTQMEQLKDSIPGLKKKVEYNVDGLPLQDLLKDLGKLYSINMNVDPSINTVVYNNFSNIPLYEVLIFLCESYNLNIKFF